MQRERRGRSAASRIPLRCATVASVSLEGCDGCVSDAEGVVRKAAIQALRAAVGGDFQKTKTKNSGEGCEGREIHRGNVEQLHATGAVAELVVH